MALFETLESASNETVGVMENLDTGRKDHHDIEGMTGLVVTSTPSHGGSATSDAAAMIDIDLVDVISGCMENQADADQLAAGLLEMEDELKALTDDTSFLQFPSILQEIFPPESPNEEASLHNEAMVAVPPSISSEYLHPKAQTELESVTDHQTIVQHPLLPLISNILQKRASQTDELRSASEQTFLHAFKSKSEMDIFMTDAVSLATQLSKDKNDIGNLMQSIDNESSHFTSEMSMFCRNLLQPDQDPVPSSNSSEQMQQSIDQLPHQNQPKDKWATENKLKIKSGVLVGKKRVRLSQRNTQILREWLLEHADNPFPTDSEKDVLCLRTGLSLSQLTTWFVNSRRRVLAPLGLKNYHKEITGLDEK